MMKICNRMLDFIQIINHKGDIRACSWINNSMIGSLENSSFYEIWHGKKEKSLWDKLAVGDYSSCIYDACPWLSMGTVDEHLCAVDGFPQYPRGLRLAFEETCNYKCTCCTSRVTWRQEAQREKEEGYKNIEEKLRPILPYIRNIGANGRGELFASPHTLRLLSEWHPVAPAEECYVSLETNGSLFDEAHWRQIENLGKYNLAVAITVMSFDEHTYQILSGTNLSVSKVEDNLHFVKYLRDKGIVNYFEIATVVQERNFRQMPEFARKCVEEFNADYVRLRPYLVHGSECPEADWFTDVRGAYHPYHEEYVQVMQDSIFKHPKVHDWGGGHDSQTGDLPQKQWLTQQKEALEKEKKKSAIVSKVLSEPNLAAKVCEIIGGSRAVLYGIGVVGRALAVALKDSGCIERIWDRNVKEKDFLGMTISLPENMKDVSSLPVIVTPLGIADEVKSNLLEKGYKGRCIGIEEIIEV